MRKEKLPELLTEVFRNKIILVVIAIWIITCITYAQTNETKLVPQDELAKTPEVARDLETGLNNRPANEKSVPAAERTRSILAAPDTNRPKKNPFATDQLRLPGTPRAQATASDWQVAIAPYFYMSGLTGTIGARGRTAEVDMDFSDVFEELNLGLMGTVEARKGRFVIVNDLLWIKLGEERDTPGGLFSSAKLGVNMFVWDPEAGYRVYEGSGGSFDVLGGVRLMSIENNLNFRAGSLPAFDVSERKTWATPVIGGHGTVNLTKKFFLSTKFDIGGGLGADFTGQFYGGGGYRLTPKIALLGGYRYMRTDYDSEGGFLFDTTMNGLLLGVKFTF